MGLVELVFVALCLNASCPEEDDYVAFKNVRRAELNDLAEKIRHETLVVTTLNNDRLSGYIKDKNQTHGTGVAFDLLDILQKKFHFNYTIVTPEENIWGSTDTGVLQMLRTNKADLSVAFLPILSEYSTKISYSPSLDTGEWVVLMKRPEASATGSGLLAPFTLPVWLLILLSLVVVGPVIHFIIYLQNRLCKNEVDKIFPLPACIWFVYGALLKQGTTLNPMSDSSRLLFATWWIFITILTAFYTANLTAFLTLSKFTLPITEAKDIGAKHYKWVTTKGNALQDTMTYDPQTRILLGDPVNFLDVSDSFILNEEVSRQNLMFIREKPIVEHVMYDNYKEKTRNNIDEPKRCTFVITKFSVATFSRAFAYSKQFKYKPLFDSAIQYLVESGIIKFKLREQLPDTEICPHNLGNKERQLLNSDLIMTYEIVGGGFIISGIIFIVELVLHRFKKRKSPGNSTEVNRWVQNVSKINLQMNQNNNYEKLGYPKTPTFITPPPSYHTLFNPRKDENIKKKNINGREYWVFGDKGGETRMIPMRTPSALLFQYTN